MTASHGNDIDAARAYGIPTAETGGISDLQPVAEVGRAHQYNSPGENLGAIGIKCPHTILGDLGKLLVEFSFRQLGGRVRAGRGRKLREQPPLNSREDIFVRSRKVFGAR